MVCLRQRWRKVERKEVLRTYKNNTAEERTSNNCINRYTYYPISFLYRIKPSLKHRTKTTALTCDYDSELAITKVRVTVGLSKCLRVDHRTAIYRALQRASSKLGRKTKMPLTQLRSSKSPL